MINDFVDYYKILEVSSKANDAELKKAFRTLAMIWHPDKNHQNPMKMKEAEAKFKQIKEAFEVLVDPIKRKAYDEGKPTPLSNIYTTDDMATTNTTTRKRMAPWDLGSDPQRPRNNFLETVVLKNSEHIALNKAKASASEHKLAFSLEDIYKGCEKRFGISRIVIDALGNTITVDEVVEVKVKPGWKKGTKITFPGRGNQEPGSPSPADLVFVLEDKPHEIFKRVGNDLVTTQKISLFEALTGKTIKVTTLDGREIEVSLTEIVTPDTEIVVQDEGMPSASNPGKKGNIRIKFHIVFPSSLQLTASQRDEMKKFLGEVDD
ncbi:hypothetical protein QN277_028802 [Acacia crassicarpa]|uniref:J domain-containing protein n=1 Tax=Acacia crassicarpa TaxID=499986 RepID=A0AAE1J882_9FABA|nr:hypothetical protein QN277_028802 [Acacia crassicarpa]